MGESIKPVRPILARITLQLSFWQNDQALKAKIEIWILQQFGLMPMHHLRPSEGVSVTEKGELQSVGGQVGRLQVTLVVPFGWAPSECLILIFPFFFELCSHAAMCPSQFDKLIQCVGDHPAEKLTKCNPDAAMLHQCIQVVADRVAAAVHSEYQKIASEKDK